MEGEKFVQAKSLVINIIEGNFVIIIIYDLKIYLLIYICIFLLSTAQGYKPVLRSVL